MLGEEIYALAPGHAGFVREPGVVQFGMDATRSGIITTRAAYKVARIINNLGTGASAADIVDQLESSGISSAAANSMVADLIGYGVLWPRPITRRVAVVGVSPLATTLADHLNWEGFAVEHLPGTQKGLRTAVKLDSPVIGVDLLHAPIDTARALRYFRIDWLPVSVVDSRAVIGPLRLSGQGPCPLCTHFHRVDADEGWNRISAQLSHRVRASDPLVIAAAAAQTVVVLRRMLGLPLPPGAQTARLLPGQAFEVDLYGHNQERIVLEHSRCPECSGLHD